MEERVEWQERYGRITR